MRHIAADPALTDWLGKRIARALEHVALHLDLAQERTAAEQVRRIAAAYRGGEVDPL